MYIIPARGINITKLYSPITDEITPIKKTRKVKTDDFNFLSGVNKALNKPDLSPIPIPIKEVINKNNGLNILKLLVALVKIYLKPEGVKIFWTETRDVVKTPLIISVFSPWNSRIEHIELRTITRIVKIKITTTGPIPFEFFLNITAS